MTGFGRSGTEDDEVSNEMAIQVVVKGSVADIMGRIFD